MSANTPDASVNMRFSSRLGFLLSVVGIAVGTGNIWRFPRIVAQNGSDEGAGAFLVAWLAFLFLWSIPLVMAEYALGRNPTNTVTDPAFRVMLSHTGSVETLLVTYAVATHAPDVNVMIQQTDNLLSPDWQTNGVAQAVATGPATNGIVPVTTTVPVESNPVFIRMHIQHDD